MLKKIVLGLLFVAVALALLFVAVGKGWLGKDEVGGTPQGPVIPAAVVAERQGIQADAASNLLGEATEQILFGDLHVHTTYSFDAFIGSLPMMQGEGAHPVADACDFARYCSALDFWSINDHAESSTPRRWQETVSTIQQCNAVAGDSANPDSVAFLGWEWTQVGAIPDAHYGHKNVIFRNFDDGEVPTRPIHSGGLAAAALRGLPFSNGVAITWLAPSQRTLDFARYLEELRQTDDCPAGVPVRELPATCSEGAETPAELFAKLDDWGFDSIVIPHGTTWGFYTPAGSTWEKQLRGDMHDASRQTLIEVYSGHGNSEEYRDFRGAIWNEDGYPVCPQPVAGHLTSCWRAGEIILERCLADGGSADDCEMRAAAARQDYVNGGSGGHLAIIGEAPEDWLDSGQCRDCYLPSFNYRAGSSVQAIMALGNFDGDGDPRRFRFGFMASSDVHKARPGTGYKEFFRQGMTESAIGPIDDNADRAFREPEAAPESMSRHLEYGAFRDGVNIELVDTGSPVRAVDTAPFMILERERQSSFFTTGGLVAAHSNGRDRNAIWDSMERREVYGTSGDRILLWFDLVNANGEATVAMGGETVMNDAPEFQVRAIGAFEQKPGCPDYAVNAMPAERLDKLCRGECYNPSDNRKIIDRIEVVRILPQLSADEDLGPLIQDPWRTLPCAGDPLGCTVSFVDEEYSGLARDAVYYVRAIQAPSLAVNAENLRCEFDEQGNCIKVDPCFGGRNTPADDDCLAMTEERAWSSPIFVDWAL